MNAPYLKIINHKLGYVIAKWAQSVDGKIATRLGDARWISSPASRQWVHELRGRMDAILVGSGTVLKDNPQLTCRLAQPRRIAARVILDTRLRTPIAANLVATADRIPTIIFTAGRNLTRKKAHQLRSAGVRLYAVPLVRNHVSLRAALKELACQGMTNILIEGGGEVFGAAFDDHLVDEAHVLVSPRFIGGRRAVSCIAGKGPARLADAGLLQWIEFGTIGQDLLYHFKVDR